MTSGTPPYVSSMLERLAATASAVLAGAGTVIGIRTGTEEPRHRVLERVGNIEIRAYEPRIAAATTIAGDPTKARAEGFNRLARYIFGGNAGGAKIAMTAPVAQGPGERIAMTAPVAQTVAQTAAGSTICFFMPADRTRATLPHPNDPSVVLIDVPGTTMAVLRFSGLTSVEVLAAKRAELLAALGGSRWRPDGVPEDWFYDPPWTLPPLRRNEVAVAVVGT